MKVFLSSTYKDLIDYREAAKNALELLGQQVNRMEVFGARPEEPLTACLDEIEQCDLFVGIYAHRYGYVPPEAAISITEMEFDHAIKLKKTVFCFTVQPDYPWPPELKERGVAKKLRELNKKFQRVRVTETFTTPDDLAFKIATSIGGYFGKKFSYTGKRPGQRLILNDSEMADVLMGIGVDPVAAYAAHKMDVQFEKSLKQGKEARAGKLRAWLLRNGTRRLTEPMQVTVFGVLQPYVLMHSGWWEKENEPKSSKKGTSSTIPAKREIPDPPQVMHGLQKWLYHGLQEWAPSWGYAWDLDGPAALPQQPFFFGQIADEMCDEAESIPVFIPYERALKCSERLRTHPGGLQVRLTGHVAHRKQFCPEVNFANNSSICNECTKQPNCLFDTRFGGALDFCIKISASLKNHGIEILEPAVFYSGYLWKCLVPKSLVADPASAKLKDSFFIWEHTNFADSETRIFNLDSLEKKHEYLENKFGPMHLLQKSSVLVPGTPSVPSSKFYSQLLDFKKS